GVRPSGAADTDGLAQRGRERALEHRLYGRPAGLELPALVGGALVLDRETELHPGRPTTFDGPTTRCYEAAMSRIQLACALLLVATATFGEPFTETTKVEGDVPAD